MSRCLVSGCSSKYDINNKKNLCYFSVPKDENMKELWKTALRQQNVITKGRRAVCEKHFLPSDIIRNRALHDKDGHVLWVSKPYKFPRLRKGVVPSQFLWTETEEVEINAEGAKKGELEGTKDVSNNTEIRNGEQRNKISVFNRITIIADDKNLRMPEQWIYMKYFNDNVKLLVFFLPVCNIIKDYEDRYTMCPQKEVILKENLILNVNILKQPIIDFPSNVRICNNVESVKQLEDTLFTVSGLNICPGVNNIPNEIGYYLAYKDIFDTWRNNNCPLIISNTLKMCEFCSNYASFSKTKTSNREG